MITNLKPPTLQKLLLQRRSIFQGVAQVWSLTQFYSVCSFTFTEAVFDLNRVKLNANGTSRRKDKNVAQKKMR